MEEILFRGKWNVTVKNMEVERDLLVYAFRYALGRMTFAPTTVVDNIKHNIEKISDNDIKLYIREIGEAEVVGILGMDCDKATWKAFRNYLKTELENRANKQQREP